MADVVIKEITLDLYKKTYVSVDAKKYDKGRAILVSFTNQDKPYSLTDNTDIYLRFQKPDSYGVFTICEKENGKAYIKLTEQMLACYGQGVGDLILVDNNIATNPPTLNEDNEIEGLDSSSVIATMNFRVNIINSPLDESEIESSDDFSALYKIISTQEKNVVLTEQNAEKSKEYEKNSKEYYEKTLDLSKSINGMIVADHEPTQVENTFWLKPKA